MTRFRKISYDKLQELVISLRSVKDDLQPSIAIRHGYIGVRVYAPDSILSSAVLSLFNRYYKGVFWFIEIDSYNRGFYFVSFSKLHLK